MAATSSPYACELKGTPARSGPEGTPMTVTFDLRGTRFVAMNGGPGHPFTDAVSFSVTCETQEEVDHYWSRLLRTP